MTDLAVVAVIVFAFSLVSGTARRTVITPPMFFVGVGMAVGPSGLGWVDLGFESAGLEIIAEATLVVVLFTDASRIDLRVLRRQYALPVRLLGLGLPMIIGLGGLTALVVLGELEVWEGFLLGAILAPTDAALGQVVVTSPRMPVKMRQTLNVESGLNDGIALPVVTLFLAFAAAEEDLRTPIGWVDFAARQIGFGALIGLVGGCLGGWLIERASRRDQMTGTFQQLAPLAVAVAVFAIADTVDGNGFIAAFVAGLSLGVITRDACDRVLDFTEDQGELLTLITFLTFGASVAGPAIGDMTWSVGLYAVLSLTFVRLLPVALSLIGTGLRWESRLLLGWFGPRGLASILFALFALEDADLAGSETIGLTVTATVLLSVLLHGLTALPATNWYTARYDSMADEHEDMAESGHMPEMRTRGSMLD